MGLVDVGARRKSEKYLSEKVKSLIEKIKEGLILIFEKKNADRKERSALDF